MLEKRNVKTPETIPDKESGKVTSNDKAKGAQDATAVPTSKVAAGPSPGTAKKPLGAKEVIPFEWKLVGKSSGFFLTLFKAVEQQEVEAQLERVRKEGYYTDLRILDANAKIEQPPAARAAAKAHLREKKAAPAVKATKAAKPVKPVRVSSGAIKKSSSGKRTKRSTVSARRSPAKSITAKTAAGAARKKAKPSKTTTKRVAKKKK